MLSIQLGGSELTSGLKGRAQKRIGLMLGNTDHRTRKVDVGLSDINGPRGGIDKKSQIHIVLIR